MYTVSLTLDDNGTVLVTCVDLPEVSTFGEDEEDALGRAADAIEEALAARISHREDVPAPRATTHRAMLERLAAGLGNREDFRARPEVVEWAAKEELFERNALHEDVAAFSADFPTLPLETRQAAAAPPRENFRAVRLPPRTVAKVELYRAMRAAGVSKTLLGRRLGWHGPQVDRLLDLNHRSTIEQLDQALRAVGKRLEISVADVSL